MWSECRQAGFSLISAIFLVVVLGSLGMFMMRFGSQQNLAGTQDLEGARGYQAARAGLDYGLYQVLQSGSCTSTNLAFPDSGLSGWATTVSCSTVGTYSDGTSFTLYSLTATACNHPVSGACPGSPDGLTYVERRLTATVNK
jgi:MSHA biogenesis protein MshP